MLIPLDDKKYAWFILSPIDEWLFRDGKPFGIGDSLASSVFPPKPSTVAGAFRTFIAEMFNLSYEKLGDAWSSEVEFIGPLVAKVSEGRDKGRVEDIVARAPVVMKKEKSGKLVKFQLKKANGLMGSFNSTSILEADSYVWYGTQAKMENVKWISLRKIFEMTSSDLKENPENYVLEDSDIYLRRYSPHASLLRESRKVKEEGGYYTVEFLQLKDDYKLLVGLNFENVASLDSKKLSKLRGNFLLFLGGERKLAYVEYLGYKTLRELIPWINKPTGAQDNITALFNLTPLLFDSLEKLRESLEHFAQIGKLITFSFDRFSFLGGWDYYKKEPKRKKIQLKTGSTFFLEGFKGKERFYKFNVDQSSSLGYNLMIALPSSLIGLSEN